MKILSAFVCLMVLVGCAGEATKSSSSAQRNLSGEWTFEIDIGAGVTLGAMTLNALDDGYRGTLTTNRGSNVLPVRSVTLAGPRMSMVVDSPQGAVTFEGELNADASAFKGVVTYHNGQLFPMSGTRKRSAT